MTELIDCEDCIYHVEGVEVNIIRYDEEANPSLVNSDVFQHFCSLRFHEVVQSITVACSDGKKKLRVGGE